MEYRAGVGLSPKNRARRVQNPKALRRIKNLGHRARITFPKSLISRFLNIVGATIAVWRRIMPIIIPEK